MTEHPPTSDAPYCLLYDGECPMCTAFAKFTDTAEAGQLKKIDARQDSVLRTQATAANMDLDYGIVVGHQGKLYYGADALTYLANRDTQSPKLKLLYLPFRSRWLSRCLYPVLVRVRWLLLWLRKTPFINNLPTKG